MLPEWLEAHPDVLACVHASEREAANALACAAPGIREFAALISPNARPLLEAMAQRARDVTSRHFGKTISLYVPLYLSNYCSGGCSYCGFASDRTQVRHALSPDEIDAELAALERKGFEEVLLLTGERTPSADFEYVRAAVARAAARFHLVTLESFAMTAEEYRALAQAGCTGITLYQETYDPEAYATVHRWGAKRDYLFRLEAPARALGAGMRTAGLGVLLGLSDPRLDALRLFCHVEQLRREYWKGGIAVSFPRICPQRGDFAPPHPVDATLLAQIVFAFRIACPDLPLVLSTRERAEFRDGMAGIGISRMSVESKTTVGGYREGAEGTSGQFEVCDNRDVDTFCAALRGKGLQPVFKNWDAVFR
jgi:2-iminoacetate synthase